MFGISMVLQAFTCQIPEVNTGSELFEGFYKRNTFFSEWVSPGNLLYWWLMNILGCMFVNIVNLLNERHYPFYDAHWSVNSFVKMTVWVTPALFIFGAVITLRGQHDLDGFCQIQESNNIPLMSEQI